MSYRPPPPPRPDGPNTAIEVGPYAGFRWREFDTAAARWAAPWWALTWLLTCGRQGRLPWEWEETEPLALAYHVAELRRAGWVPILQTRDVWQSDERTGNTGTR